ncbi:LOW QUALITY PROTEIN: two-pore potassium channel 2-like [Curcuma longa]|uniref:LOW QUALITY PROTEIN: two-pore potassium channel 2-like n=1 Tax=Curcuma longa TaxID=136217 RepID=UPI003D9F337B
MDSITLPPPNSCAESSVPVIVHDDANSLSSPLLDPHFRRSHSSPSIFADSRAPSSSAIDLQPIARPPPTALSFMKLATGSVVLYVSVGVAVYAARHKSFEGRTTGSPIVDGLYFTVVSLCTIGYGDLVPGTQQAAKLFACAFILVGFGFIDCTQAAKLVLGFGLLVHALDWQEEALLAAVDAGGRRALGRALFLVDVRKRRMRVRIKVALALAVVVACIAFGAAAACALEGLCWVDSFYLAVASMTTMAQRAEAEAAHQGGEGRAPDGGREPRPLPLGGGLLSKAEELAVLSAATDPATPGALLGLSLALLALGPLCVYLVPEEQASEVALQVAVAVICALGGSAASNFAIKNSILLVEELLEFVK